jgi:hypothetical protein
MGVVFMEDEKNGLHILLANILLSFIYLPYAFS